MRTCDHCVCVWGGGVRVWGVRACVCVCVCLSVCVCVCFTMLYLNKCVHANDILMPLICGFLYLTL